MIYKFDFILKTKLDDCTRLRPGWVCHTTICVSFGKAKSNKIHFFGFKGDDLLDEDCEEDEDDCGGWALCGRTFGLFIIIF